MNFGRKMKAGVAAVAAIATLGAGGVVASTAFAGGGGGNPSPARAAIWPRCSSGSTRTTPVVRGVRPRVLIRCAPP